MFNNKDWFSIKDTKYYWVWYLFYWISPNLLNFVPLPQFLDNRCYHKFSSKRFEYLDFTNSMVFAEIFIISKNIMTRQIRNFILEIFDLWTMMLICLSFITMTFIIWFSNSIINTISKNYRFGRLKSKKQTIAWF